MTLRQLAERANKLVEQFDQQAAKGKSSGADCPVVLSMKRVKTPTGRLRDDKRFMMSYLCGGGVSIAPKASSDPKERLQVVEILFEESDEV